MSDYYSLIFDKSSSAEKGFTLKSKTSSVSVDENVEWCPSAVGGDEPKKGLVKLLIGRSGSQQTLTCDKRKLTASSAYFAQRIIRDMDSELPEWVVLHDADVEALEIILMFISNGTLPSKSLSLELILRVLESATQFEMEEVRKQFRNQIKNNVKGIDAAVEVLEIGNRLGDVELRRLALGYLIPRFSALIKSKAFLSLTQPSICALLRNEIVVKSESLLFDVIIKWVESECKKRHMDSTNYQHFRAVVGDICNLIRFPTMTSDYFQSTVVLTGLLTTQDRELLEHYWKLLETDSIAAAAMSLPFEKSQRTGKRYSVTVFARKASTKIWHIPAKQWMTIKLRSECSIKVHSLLLHGVGENKGPIPVKTQLIVKVGSGGKGKSRYRTENSQDAIVRLAHDHPGSSRLELDSSFIISAGRKYKFAVFFIKSLQDDSEGSLHGSDWTAGSAKCGQQKFRLLAKKVKGGDFLFHSLEFSLEAAYNKENDTFFIPKEDIGHHQSSKNPSNCGIV